MAAKVTRQLEYIINGRDQSKAAFKSVEGSVRRIEGVLKSAGTAIAAYFSVREIGRFAKDSLLLASSAEEAASKFEQVFGPATESATNRLDAFSVSAGRSRYELRETAGDFGALLVPMGLATDQAADMSVELSKLSTDLASFFNTSDEQARTALRAGLVGESEPLRKYGVQLSALRIEQEAFASGIGRTGAKLTAAEKAQAAYNIILKDSVKAQGDAIRTGEGFANQLRTLQGDWNELKVEIGQGFLPIATEVLNWVNDTTGGIQELGVTIRQVSANAKADLFRVYDTLVQIGDPFGLTGISEQNQTVLKILDKAAQEENRRALLDILAIRRSARGPGLNTGSAFDFVGPLPPDGGIDAFRAGIQADNGPLEVEVVNQDRSFGAGPTSNTAAVAGNFITGLAQATRSTVDVQKKSLFAIEENKRINAEMRDILRSIRDGQGSGVQLVGGVFS